MKSAIDISRPDFIFSLLWGTTLCLMIFFPIPFTVAMHDEIVYLIFINIFSFHLIYFITSKIVKTRNKNNLYINYNSHLYFLPRFSKILFRIWIPLYIINVILSGGVPFIWKLIGDPRTYVDYGVPTFSGFLNMIRAFLLASYVLCSLLTKRKKYLFVPFLLLITLLAEVSRGNITAFMLHGIGMYFLMNKRLGRIITFSIIGATLFILMFGFIADFRGAHMEIKHLVGEQEFFLEFHPGIFWVYAYMTTPINNVFYAYTYGIEPLYYPYFSIQALVPTVIRNFLFPLHEYPVKLVSDGFNATSFYSPLIADFGLVGAGFIVIILQTVTSYIHVKAKKGDMLYILIYPVLFMCVVLSLFYFFFFSMVTVLYPLLALAYLRYFKIKMKRISIL